MCKYWSVDVERLFSVKGLFFTLCTSDLYMWIWVRLPILIISSRPRYLALLALKLSHRHDLPNSADRDREIGEQADLNDLLCDCLARWSGIGNQPACQMGDDLLRKSVPPTVSVKLYLARGRPTWEILVQYNDHSVLVHLNLCLICNY